MTAHAPTIAFAGIDCLDIDVQVQISSGFVGFTNVRPFTSRIKSLTHTLALIALGVSFLAKPACADGKIGIDGLEELTWCMSEHQTKAAFPENKIIKLAGCEYTPYLMFSNGRLTSLQLNGSEQGCPPSNISIIDFFQKLYGKAPVVVHERLNIWFGSTNTTLMLVGKTGIVLNTGNPVCP